MHEPDFGDYDEERYFTMGMSNKARLLILNWTIRNDNFRLISSRLCEPHQRKRYEKRNFH
ncbi:BrnT family toxin [Moraxella bovis]|uniref:BrnT family toxin n=1 Tax=Moraxella bovis TaxID=476 RepID=UPI000DC792CF|nr:hypothetical protein DQF64_04330 [Moraxella bovis]